MLNFYGNKFTSDINHFIKKAKDRVRALDRDNQRFIEDIFTKGNYRNYGEIFENNMETFVKKPEISVFKK